MAIDFVRQSLVATSFPNFPFFLGVPGYLAHPEEHILMRVVHLTAGCILVWIVLVITVLGVLLEKEDLLGTHVYRMGPNPDLYILGFCVDTVGKYVAVAAFCFVNSAIRTINGEILRSWITNQVQDISKPIRVTTFEAYTISCVASVFGWFDFFMYMNILLAQVDMMFIEISADLVMTILVTAYYLTGNPGNREPRSPCSRGSSSE